MARTQQEGQAEGQEQGQRSGQGQEHSQGQRQELGGRSGPVDTNNNNNDNNNNSSNTSTGSSSSSSKSDSNDASPGTVGCGGKYQLRPRALQGRRRSDSEWSLPQDSLRHSKQRPPPLSRYRRKTANARERYRMRQINRAFESLRCALPAWVVSRRAAADMTKITTLRLASAYIRSLQEALQGGEVPWGLDGATASQGHGGSEDGSPGPQDADLLTLLCTDATVLGDNLGGLAGLAPVSESEAVALLLGGSEPPRVAWSDLAHSHAHTQVVTSG